jgi:hypothetical protein
MLTQRRWALALALTASAAACGDGSSVVGGPTQDATVSNRDTPRRDGPTRCTRPTATARATA